MPGATPPPLGQPVIGGQLSGGRTIGGTGPVPIAEGVAARATGGPPPPTVSGPRPSQRSAPRPGHAGPPQASGPRPPRASGPWPTQSPGPQPPPSTRRRWVPVAAVAAAVVVLAGVIGTTIAVTGDGGGEQTTGGTSGSTGDGSFGATVPTADLKQEGSSAVFVMSVDGYEDGDKYFVRMAPERGDLDRATAYGVQQIADGTGTFSQEFGTADQLCGQAQARRGEEPDEVRTPWSDVTCVDKE